MSRFGMRSLNRLFSNFSGAISELFDLRRPREACAYLPKGSLVLRTIYCHGSLYLFWQKNTMSLFAFTEFYTTYEDTGSCCKTEAGAVAEFTLCQGLQVSFRDM